MQYKQNQTTNKNETAAPNHADAQWKAECRYKARIQVYQLLEIYEISVTATEAEHRQLANLFRQQWEVEKDELARVKTALLYQLLGEIERIRELGYEVPWYYQG